ncbi:MAG: conjugal transfer protein TraD [Paraprevotella clara]|nr:conjugal transfer protein TraD [Paraprevotella clara]
MNETISMTDILLAVSVGCNLWFLFLLLYERIMDTRLVRFFKGIAGLWRSLERKGTKSEATHEEAPTEKADIIGKSRFRMASTWTTSATLVPHAATSEKGIEVSEEDATFDDGNTGTASRTAQVPEEKLDETFTSIPPEELEYGEDEPEEDASDMPRASGSSFDEIDDACKTAKNPDATQAEREKAAKVFTDMEGTELYDKMMDGSSEIGIRIKGLIEIRLKKPQKVFIVPDNIEEFDIRNYV